MESPPNSSESERSTPSCDIKDVTNGITEFEISYKNTKTGECKTANFVKPYLILGKSLRSHLYLNDDEIGYRHILLVALDGRIFCVDLSNRNGVQWAGAKWSSGWVKSEDTLYLGPFEITVRLKSCSTDVQFPVEGNPLDDRITKEHGESFQPHLEWIKDGNVKKRIHLSHVLSLLGSNHRCQMRFLSPSVSGMHCAFLRDADRLFVIDLLGKKGTRVNDQKMKFRKLQHGDIVSVGRYQLRVDTTTLTRTLFDSMMDNRKASPIDTHEIWIKRIHQNTLIPSHVLQEVIDQQQPDSFQQFSEELASQNQLTRWQTEKLISPENYKLILQKRYYLREKIARGGTSSIYRAFDCRLKREVAIKVPRGNAHLYPKLLKRLQREATAIAQIHHPNIVAVLDINQKATYIVMELIDGKNLKEQVFEHGPLLSTLAIDYTLQLLDAVKALHQTGIIHRDIKPSNILVKPDGQIKLLDMGLARFDGSLSEEFFSDRDDTEPLTRVGTLLGTVCYMAPEQAEYGTNADERSDIYSIGCTLYEFLAGKPPFQSANRLDILKKHADDPVDPIKNIGEQLTKVLEKSLEKSPQDRFQSVEEFSQSLKKCQ